MALDKKEEEEKELLLKSQQLDDDSIGGKDIKDLRSSLESKNLTIIDEKEVNASQDCNTPPKEESEEVSIKNKKTVKQYISDVGVNKIDHILLKKDGTLWISDAEVDIFSRFAFPIVYIILCGIQYKHYTQATSP